jgi:hypothetical protein
MDVKRLVMLVADTLLAAIMETDVGNVFDRALRSELGALAVRSTFDRLFGCLCQFICHPHLCSLYSISRLSSDAQGR